MPDEPVRVQPETDPNKFLQAIRALEEPQPQAGRAHFEWFFRGQRCASWNLAPSSFRYAKRNKILTAQAQASLERHALGLFFNHCDRIGLPVPGDTPALRDALEDAIPKQGWYRGIPRELIPVAALAQHHGVPTRLLDWTRHPLTAAYFACRHAGEPGWEPAADLDPIAVWALRIRSFQPDAAVLPLEADGMRVHLASAPRATNPNLHAQSGIFTMTEMPEPTGDDPAADYRDILDIVAKVDQSWNPHIIKYTFPGERAKHLLELLWSRGVDRLHLFPSYESAAATTRDWLDFSFHLR